MQFCGANLNGWAWLVMVSGGGGGAAVDGGGAEGGEDGGDEGGRGQAKLEEEEGKINGNCEVKKR